MNIQSFFGEATSRLTYVVHDEATGARDAFASFRRVRDASLAAPALIQPEVAA
jgi:hypothetical protein